MEKYLVTIEFRYKSVTRFNEPTFTFKTVTIGVYDDFKYACEQGNTLIRELERRFDLHVFPDGTTAPKERFSKNGGCFGSKKTLITNSAYLKTPFQFYAKIDTLTYLDVNIAIDDVLNSIKQ